MKRLPLATKMLRRNWSAGELRVLLLALVIAVASVTTVGFFADRVQAALDAQANELLGGDLAVITDHPTRPEIVELAHKLRDDLARDVMAVYDDTAAIGKLYRRQDEIGTPWCVCIDVESLEDGAATIRDRDAMTQDRVAIDQIKRVILDRMAAARG